MGIIFEQAVEMLTARTTAELLEMLGQVENAKPPTEEWRVKMWIFEAIERKHDVTAAMEAWSEDLDTTLTYAQALRQAVSI